MFAALVILSIALFNGAFGLKGLNLCKATIDMGGLSLKYNETIGHAVHSMTVQGLKLFHPGASVFNKIPTVNKNLQDPLKVVSAPDVTIPDDYATWSMNVLDDIMSKIGNDDDGLGPHWSPIERVVHRFHMWDLWQKILKVYKDDVVKSPPTNELCACLTDTTSNGIAQAVYWVAEHYKTGTPITLLDRPIPKLTNATTWAVWKERFLYYYTPEALHDAALYMYCAVKDF